MAVKCQTVINFMESFAPKNLAEHWDNVGLQVGSPGADITKVLVSLDVNEKVVQEAEQIGANLIISHHPLFFKPINNLRLDSPFGVLINKLILKGINVYSAHTNLDSATEGVNKVLADILDLRKVEVLNPDKTEELVKLVIFVPEGHEEPVRDAVTKAGAGWIGNYSDCTFQTDGVGTFKGLEGTDPFLGAPGVLEKVREKRVETIVPPKHLNSVIKALLKAHPYEEVAYDLYPLLNKGRSLGIGRVGKLAEPLNLKTFCTLIKDKLGVSHLKVVGAPTAEIFKVAVCGGSGGSFIKKAQFVGADILVTGDIKYHEAQEAQSLGINLVDAGHYATEKVVVPVVARYLKDALSKNNVEIVVSTVNTDPFDFF